MFDYRLTYPAAVDDTATIDLQAMLANTDWSAPFRLQRELLRALVDEIGADVPIVETVYSPWMYLLRHVGRGFAACASHQSHDLAEVLSRLTEETRNHVRRVREMGCFGIYFATLAADRSLPTSAAERQHDVDVLEAGAGIVRMLHLHGRNLDATAVNHYPREVLHLESGGPDHPTLADLRADSRCLMGGLSSSTLTTVSMSEMQRQLADAIAGAGPEGLIIAPGCIVSPSLSARKMKALLDPALLRV
ncbi:uroporphyrinogen decarboxylase family protein [Mesorhizobium marinum]|uniref:Uroporphyrinogen decarboxylase family protein n=1 Tax=Mesorhizobium marinum TaxID=3228790 RepID=A0ABV3QYI8_9HYPH